MPLPGRDICTDSENAEQLHTYRLLLYSSFSTVTLENLSKFLPLLMFSIFMQLYEPVLLILQNAKFIITDVLSQLFTFLSQEILFVHCSFQNFLIFLVQVIDVFTFYNLKKCFNWLSYYTVLWGVS